MVLVTGGLGYIGSNMTKGLIENGYDVVIVDNLVNSNIDVLHRLNKITNKNIKYYNVDILNKTELEKVFKENKIEYIIHFAAYKAVGESCEKPLMYYENNISGLINLLLLATKYNVNNFIFSSSATVYNQNSVMPLKETSETSESSNPYGQTKIISERILKDLVKSNKNFKVVFLRYFNPIGADNTYSFGDDPNGIPNNLLPYVLRVVTGKLEKLTVFGNDYDTKDGTCLRDYIHVTDLCNGHIKALKKMDSTDENLLIYNLGTGKPSSVLDIINATKKVTNKDVKYVFGPRRAGDLPVSYTDPTKMHNELGFYTKYSLEDMIYSQYMFELNKK